jgi:hypothetical protein
MRGVAQVGQRLINVDLREYSAGAALAALSLWLEAVTEAVRSNSQRPDVLVRTLPPSLQHTPYGCSPPG